MLITKRSSINKPLPLFEIKLQVVSRFRGRDYSTVNYVNGVIKAEMRFFVQINADCARKASAERIVCNAVGLGISSMLFANIKACGGAHVIWESGNAFLQAKRARVVTQGCSGNWSDRLGSGPEPSLR